MIILDYLLENLTEKLFNSIDITSNFLPLVIFSFSVSVVIQENDENIAIPCYLMIISEINLTISMQLDNWFSTTDDEM